MPFAISNTVWARPTLILSRLFLSAVLAFSPASHLIAEKASDDYGHDWKYVPIGDYEAKIYAGALCAAISPDPKDIVDIPVRLDGRYVTTIGEYAFLNCTNMTGARIPSTVETISRYSFGNCTSLKSISIPNGVASIGTGAFSNCTSLASISISSSVVDIGTDVFLGCSSLTTITVDSANKKYSSKNGLLLSKDGSVLVYGRNGDVVVPEGVKSIGEAAFWGCDKLTSVTYPASLTNIGASAFYGCSGLSSVSIPDGVTAIGAWAFFACTNLASVTFSEGLTMVEVSSFGNCKNIGKFTLRPSEGVKDVVVKTLKGIDATNIVVEVAEGIKTVRPNGAAVRILGREGYDVTHYLDIPEEDGVMMVAEAKVKRVFAEEILDPSKGAKINLNPSSLSLTTAPTRPGLTYTLREGWDLQSMADGDAKIGDGVEWEPEIRERGGRRGFYGIRVGW